jgi:FKBP-type peptidyl-prolyl cis-trans isomerase (trigger factor)
MKVSIENAGDHRKRVRVEAGWDKVEPDYRDILAEYSKLPVPGFRPGKAPEPMVERHFERHLLDDTAGRSVRRLSRRALEDERITVTGPISITELSISRGGRVSFTAEFTQLPSFELPEYRSMGLADGSDAALRDEISLRLLEDTEIEIPDEMVKEELLFEGDTSSRPGDDPWDAAEARVKLLLILAEIARRDGIEVDERDLDDRIERMAIDQGTDASSLKMFLLRNGGLSRISGFILAERTLNYMIDINVK